MRLKILFLFVGIQIFSFGIWHTLANQPIIETTHLMEDSVIPHAAATKQVFDMDFLSRNLKSNQEDTRKALKTLLTSTLSQLPEEHSSSLKSITLDFDPNAHRGLGGRSKIILRSNMSSNELVSVFIHELGHSVDLGWLAPEKRIKKSRFKDGKTIIYSTDPSVDFYSISWKNEKTLKKMANNLDFVSGYAMSDPFEDFAETYVYYVLHNSEFRSKTSSSNALYAKYKFMRDVVFNGEEPSTGNRAVRSTYRPWDITLLSYNFERFLNT